MMQRRDGVFHPLLNLAKYDRVADIKHDCGCKPRDRVGDVKRFGCSEFRKDGVYPNNTHRAGTDKADEHRGSRGAESAKHSRHYLHKSA